MLFLVRRDDVDVKIGKGHRRLDEVRLDRREEGRNDVQRTRFELEHRSCSSDGDACGNCRGRIRHIAHEVERCAINHDDSCPLLIIAQPSLRPLVWKVACALMSSHLVRKHGLTHRSGRLHF